jgi:hypothetical protein
MGQRTLGWFVRFAVIIEKMRELRMQRKKHVNNELFTFRSLTLSKHISLNLLFFTYNQTFYMMRIPYREAESFSHDQIQYQIRMGAMVRDFATRTLPLLLFDFLVLLEFSMLLCFRRWKEKTLWKRNCKLFFTVDVMAFWRRREMKSEIIKWTMMMIKKGPAKREREIFDNKFWLMLNLRYHINTYSLAGWCLVGLHISDVKKNESTLRKKKKVTAHSRKNSW